MKAFHDKLNPLLWDNYKLKTEVAKKLKEIATAFIEFLEVPKEAIEDIVLTGSCASYNYTPQSDIDLHLLVDFDKVHKDCPIVGNYLISKKSEFNNNHDIFIYGIPVEVYAEATDNENVHNGLYSLKSGKWIDEPQKLKPLDNDVAVNAKYKELSAAIKEVADKEEAQQLIDKIKRMRKSGLASEGEFSVENLVFKKLRNEGLIGKLMDIRKEGIDKELSLEECFSLIEQYINEVSVGAWARAAENNLPKRKEKAEASAKAAEYVKNNTSSNVKDYVKPERTLTKKGAKRKNINFHTDVDYDAYNKAQDNVRTAGKEAQEAEKRAKHAEEVSKLNLPKNSKVSANKLTDAARSSWSERFDINQKNLNKTGEGQAKESFKRVNRAHNIKFADPSFQSKGKKEETAKSTAREIENAMNKKDTAIKNSEKGSATNYGDRERLESLWKKAFAGSKQAKIDHDNAQILQGMKNKLEKIYNSSESLEELYEGLIGVLQETICTSTAVMAPYPVDVVGRPSPFGKGKRVKRGKEKRAPHTEVYESYEKQSKGSQKPAMYKYSYKKVGRLGNLMENIATICEAIISESTGERIKGNFLPKIKAEIATIKAKRRNANKIEQGAIRDLHKAEKNPYSKDFPIKSLMLKDKISQNRKERYAAEDKVKELADLRNKLEK